MQIGFAFLLLLLSAGSFAQEVPTPEVPVPEVPTEVPAPVPVNPNQQKLDSLTNITRLAFGSCNNQNDAQPLWKDVLKTKPDLFVWAGDIIYADWEQNYDLAKSWDKQKNNPAYQEVLKQTPVIGVWDDHDYSWNDANGRSSSKEKSQKLFLDFLDTPEDSPRRTQEGVYTSYEFGEEGKRIKIILLDNRYFKGLEDGAPILGEKQWLWLENELKNSSAQLHFIMSGLPIFAPVLPYSEEWWHYPVEVNRMLKLVKTYKPQGVMFLSGDKHFGATYKSSGQLEMISSGMTHVVDSRAWWYIARKYGATWFGLNYGMIDIAWDGTIPLITTSFRTVDHRDIHKFKYRWEKTGWKRL